MIGYLTCFFAVPHATFYHVAKPWPGVGLIGAALTAIIATGELFHFQLFDPGLFVYG